MHTILPFPVENRRHRGDRRIGERRQRNIPVALERRRTPERRTPGERRQQDLRAFMFAQSSQQADRLCSELAKVPADNPISRLLVLQTFLLDHCPGRSNEWIMRWARHLRTVYSGGDIEEMRRCVFRALHGDTSI
jgi:hypothetical protein